MSSGENIGPLNREARGYVFFTYETSKYYWILLTLFSFKRN